MVKSFEIIKNQNPWWENPDWQNIDQHLLALKDKSYAFNRPEKESLNSIAGLPSINIIRGPRQVGKTTLIKQVIQKIFDDKKISRKNILFLTCETIEDYKELEEILFPWLKSSKDQGAIFLDEVSFVKEWSRAILAFSNQGLISNKTLYITGSNARDLKKMSERLPGRRGGGKDILLYPLSFDEIRTLECFSNYKLEELIDIYLKVGGFPHAIRDYCLHHQVLDETYQTYQKWIIGDAVKFHLDETILKQLYYRIYETMSSRISWKSLIETTTVKSHETALSYIERMEDAFIANVLYFYDNNKNMPNPNKQKKIYFIDPLLYYMALSWKTGLTNIYQMVNELSSKNDFLGKIFEAIVIAKHKKSERHIYFWYSTKTKKEVDLLLPAVNNEVKLFEIKYTNENKVKNKIMGSDVSKITKNSFLNDL